MNKKIYRTIDSNSGLIVWEVLLAGARQARKSQDVKRAVELYQRAIKASEEYFYKSSHTSTVELSLELDVYLLELRLSVPLGVSLHSSCWA